MKKLSIKGRHQTDIEFYLGFKLDSKDIMDNSFVKLSTSTRHLSDKIEFNLVISWIIKVILANI